MYVFVLQNLKELLTLKEKEIKEYKDKVDHLQTTADELTAKLRTQEMAVSEAGQNISIPNVLYSRFVRTMTAFL